MESVDFTTEDLLNELQQYHNPIEDRKPGGITRKELAIANNISKKLAKTILEGEVAEGKLIREFNRLGPGARGYVYYKNTE
jgi:hypothetical protein